MTASQLMLFIIFMRAAPVLTLAYVGAAQLLL